MATRTSRCTSSPVPRPGRGEVRAVSDDVTTRVAKLDQKSLQSTLQTELTSARPS